MGTAAATSGRAIATCAELARRGVAADAAASPEVGAAATDGTGDSMCKLAGAGIVAATCIVAISG